MKSKPLVVIGSANMDLVTRVKAFPSPGETVGGGALQQRTGGKGFNQAIAAARAGVPVSFIGNIGQGDFGDALVNDLQRADVDLRHLDRSATLPAGTALIWLNQAGENQIVVTQSSNDLVDVTQITRAKRLIQDAGLILLQLEVPFASVRAAVQLAKEARVPVILNPAPLAKPLPKMFLRQIDWLTPNEHELTTLVGSMIKTSREVEAGARRLLETGVKNVVVTCGARGACWASGEKIEWFPAPKVQVIDTVGAGDCFNGLLAAGLLHGVSLQSALANSVAEASKSVSSCKLIR